MTLPGSLNLGLTIPLVNATAIMKDHVFAFGGSSADPFEGTFLDDIIEAPLAQLDAFVDRGNGDFRVSYSQHPGKFLGITIPGFAYSSIVVNNHGATITQEFPVIGLRPYVRGTFSFDTGTMELTASLPRTSKEFGPFSAFAEFDFRLANYVGYHWVGNKRIPTWGVSFTGHLAAGGTIETFFCDFGVAVEVDFVFAAATTGSLYVSGSAGFSVHACGLSAGGSTGTVSLSYVSWDLPDPLPDLRMPF